MPKLLLKQVIISDKFSEFHQQQVDIGIENGIITAIDWQLEESDYDDVLNYNGCIATGHFIDVRCNSSEPGNEHRETLESLCNVAIHGGYGKVALLPNCNPVRQRKSDIDFVNQFSKSSKAKLLPIGAITNNTTDENLTELYDMHQSGAIAFSNANNSIFNSGTLSKALLYSKTFNGLIYSFCFDENIAPHASVAEGAVAVSLGLKGIPTQSEFIMVQRDIELADYHQAKIHISKISCEKSVELIRQAKAQGIQVTCDVAVMNLVLTDETLMDFDSNLKLMPPLRSANEVKALWEGIKDGTIDAICSDHHPYEIEKKAVEFSYASYGSISLQIALNLAIEGRNRFMPQLPDDILFEKLNTGPSKILGLQAPNFSVGKKAEITIINPNKQTTLNKHNNQSKSNNTYYFNKPLPYFIESTFNS